MEVHNKKGFIIMHPLAFFAIMLILLNGYAAAAVLVETNTTFRCDGRLDECLIQDDLELEFLMDPFLSRVLADQTTGSYGQQAVSQPDSSTFDECKPSPTYSCSAKPGNQNNHPASCPSVFSRPCP